jgi:hypothetical protein
VIKNFAVGLITLFLLQNYLRVVFVKLTFGFVFTILKSIFHFKRILSSQYSNFTKEFDRKRTTRCQNGISALKNYECDGEV